MLWLAWRQQRIAVVVTVAASVVLAIVVAALAAYAQRLRVELGVDTCVPSPSTNMGCVALEGEWQRRVVAARYLVGAFYLAPALIASYLGGPLFARELERGTHRLGWTQGIGRVRWAATMLGILVLATLAAGAIMGLVGGRTRLLLGTGTYRPWDTFDQEGPAILAFTVFGLALGAFIGAWWRRILAGMLYGLVAFALVRGAVSLELRPRYDPPVAVNLRPMAPFTFGPGSSSLVPPDAWTVGYDAVDTQGATVPQERVQALLDEYSRRGCPAGQRSCDSVTYLNERGVYQRFLYQPADRYWKFQATEAALYLVLTAGLVALTLWILRTRDA